MTTYPDLSDCETTYVGTDPNRRPERRLVWRELPPKERGGKPRRQVIVLGPRDAGEAYHEAGRRLGREAGVRLLDLPSTAERAAADRETLRRVRDSARDTARDVASEQNERPIGRGEPPELDR